MTTALGAIMGIGSNLFFEGGLSMAKTTLAKHVSKLLTLLSSLVLVLCLTVGPLYANSGSKQDQINMAVDTLKRHVEKVKESNPGISGIDEKARQTEEGLRAGAISLKDSCSNCHTRDGGKGSAGR